MLLSPPLLCNCRRWFCWQPRLSLLQILRFHLTAAVQLHQETDTGCVHCHTADCFRLHHLKAIMSRCWLIHMSSTYTAVPSLVIRAREIGLSHISHDTAANPSAEPYLRCGISISPIQLNLLSVYGTVYNHCLPGQEERPPKLGHLVGSLICWAFLGPKFSTALLSSSLVHGSTPSLYTN